MKIKYQFNETELASLSELKDEIIQAKRLMNSEDSLDKYISAACVLCSYINQYNDLSENEKKHLDVDIGDLEKLAVNILVNQGHPKLVGVDLLKKYGLYCGEKGK